MRSRINRIGGGGGCIRLTWISILSSKSTEKSGKWRNPKDSENTFSYSSNDNQPLYWSNAKFVTLLGFSCWCMKSKEVTNKNFKPLLLWSQNICTHANKMKTFFPSTSLDRYLKFIRKIIKNSLSSCFLFYLYHHAHNNFFGSDAKPGLSKKCLGIGIYWPY